jgi:maltose phosphorylase
LLDTADERASEARRAGFDVLLQEHTDHWAAQWEKSDIRIKGDASAQQGIRFNIFQLHQTYTGEDERLNIGPKGFTGEKYGGSTYWDTEAYCLPFYLSTAPQKVAKNLLVYRYDQLGKAIENAAKLGFENGAALYPMVTMNGEECHNEWEITFEEIHRNGAIAFAIYDYIRHTLDASYLFEGGLEVLTGIARFWFQRFHYSQRKRAFVMHGVTGPNEYENNINNNWYTNYIAAWCMRYTADCFDRCKQEDAKRTEALSSRLDWSKEEGMQWRDRADRVYLPQDEEHGVFEQHEGFMDKELVPAERLDPDERPINQHWSWDRILRSCFIKQADVLQGVYLFSEEFDRETHERNFDFYEPFTVHESSLSPCVHAILAARLGKMDKAYELYLRTARLDLDDYNKEVAEGLHITSMAGTWMSVVQGFGGMHWVGSDLHLDPALPDQWTALEFHLRFRGALLRVQVEPTRTEVLHLSGEAVELKLYGTKLKLSEGSAEQIERP